MITREQFLSVNNFRAEYKVKLKKLLDRLTQNDWKYLSNIREYIIDEKPESQNEAWGYYLIYTIPNPFEEYHKWERRDFNDLCFAIYNHSLDMQANENNLIVREWVSIGD